MPKRVISLWPRTAAARAGRPGAAHASKPRARRFGPGHFWPGALLAEALRAESAPGTGAPGTSAGRETADRETAERGSPATRWPSASRSAPLPRRTCRGPAAGAKTDVRRRKAAGGGKPNPTSEPASKRSSGPSSKPSSRIGTDRKGSSRHRARALPLSWNESPGKPVWQPRSQKAERPHFVRQSRRQRRMQT